LCYDPAVSTNHDDWKLTGAQIAEVRRRRANPERKLVSLAEAKERLGYSATPEELHKIDEALAAVRRGEVATDQEVEAVFVRHRRS
jgi:hypothetical protein